MKTTLIFLGGLVLGLLVYFGYTQTKQPIMTNQQNNFLPIDTNAPQPSSTVSNTPNVSNTPVQNTAIQNTNEEVYSLPSGGKISFKKLPGWSMSAVSGLEEEGVEFNGKEGTVTIHFENQEWGGAACPTKEKIIIFKNKTSTACLREDQSGIKWYGFIYVPLASQKGYRVDVRIPIPTQSNESTIFDFLKTISFN